MKIRINKANYNLNVLFILFLALTVITPYFANNLSYFRFVQIAFSVVFVASTMLYKGKKQTDLILPGLLLIWFMVEILYMILGVSTVGFVALYLRILPFITIFAMLTISNRFSGKQMKVVFWGVWVITFINLLDNIRLGTKYLVYLKFLTSSASGLLETTNLGSTDFCATVLLFYMVCLLVFFNRTDRGVRIWMILGMIASAYYLVLVNTRATCILLLVVGTILMITSSTKRKGWFPVLIILAAVVVVTCAIPFLEWAASSVDDYEMSLRFNELISILQGKDTAYSGGTRIDYAQMSIETFLAHPLTGVGVHPNTVSQARGVGLHSYFIDLFAQYGIMFALFNFFIFFRIFKHFGKMHVSDLVQRQMQSVFGVFIVYMFLNNAGASTYAVLFILMPASCCLFEFQERRNGGGSNVKKIVA